MKLRIYYLFIVAAILLCSYVSLKRLPKIFLIGDSISIQYGPYLENYLKEVAFFERKQDDGQAEKNLDVPTGANGGDSRMVLAYLKAKMNDKDFTPDFLLLNCGLHDIKKDPLTQKLQVPADEYRSNLETICQLLEDKHIQLIWIRTTQVVDSIHNPRQRSFHRYASDLETYNGIADEICLAHQVPMIDLYGFTLKLGDDRFTDHVHYKEPVRNLQAAYIAGCISSLISNNSNK